MFKIIHCLSKYNIAWKIVLYNFKIIYNSDIKYNYFDNSTILFNIIDNKTLLIRIFIEKLISKIKPSQHRWENSYIKIILDFCHSNVLILKDNVQSFWYTRYILVQIKLKYVLILLFFDN